MQWLLFPVHSYTSPSMWGVKPGCHVTHVDPSSADSAISTKLALLKFAASQGLSFSFCSWTRHPSTPPVPSKLEPTRVFIFADRLSLSQLQPPPLPPSLHVSGPPCCVPAQTQSHVLPFLAVDFFLCISFKSVFCCFVSQPWTSVYVLGGPAPFFPDWWA